MSGTDVIIPSPAGGPIYYMSNGSGLLVETPLVANWCSLGDDSISSTNAGVDISQDIMLQQMALAVSGLLGTIAGATTITISATGEVDL